MIAYKANTMRWTQEEGFQTTDNIIIGKLWRNPEGPWTIAFEVEDGTGAVKDYMVDKTTVEEVRVKKVSDEVKQVYWYEEEAGCWIWSTRAKKKLSFCVRSSLLLHETIRS